MNLIPLSFILTGFLALPAVAAGSSPAPALVYLDQVLTQTLLERQQGQLAPERVPEFAAKFRVDLAAAKADAPPTPENADLHARILARLGELDPAGSATRPAPLAGDSRSGLSRAHFQGTTTPAVIAEEKRVLSSEPFNGNRDGQDGVVFMGGRRFRFAARRAAASLLANLPIVPPPVHDGGPANPAGLAALAALSATGAMLLFGGWGGDKVEKTLPGTRNRMGIVAAFGGFLATAGFMLLPAAPLVAQEEPQISSALQELKPLVVDEGDKVEKVVLDRGERGLHLFKFNNPTSTIADAWGKGDHFLYLRNQGSPAANWAQNSRALRIAMREGRPIYDSYVDALTGKQIPTSGFLNAERNLLESRVWEFNSQTGAYHPPAP